MIDINRELGFARQYAEGDPVSSLYKCRLITEMILKKVWSEVNESENTPKELDILITQLKDDMPKEIRMHCYNLQNFGNFGSHDQAGESPSQGTVRVTLESVAVLISWFDPEHKEIDSQPIEIEAEESISEPVSKPSVTIRKLMHKMVKDKKLSPEDIITTREILQWFKDNKGSTHKKSAINTHISMMTTNGESRLSHPLKEDGSDELFFRLKKGQYRLYNRGADPAPITEIEQFSGWEGKLLIVNTATSFPVVNNSGVYMSPNKAGNYKQPRAKFIGLYINRAVRSIGEIYGKVNFSKSKSKGRVWYNNGIVSDDELVELAIAEINSRDRSDWDEPFPAQVVVFSDQIELNFNKETPGGWQRNNKWISTCDYRNLSGLVMGLDGLSWGDWPPWPYSP
jgi:hypothetical protein